MYRTTEPVRQNNVGTGERAASIASGAGMLLLAAARPSKLSLPLIAGGGYLLLRGISGKCLAYQALEIERAGENGSTGIYVERALTINKPRHEIYAFWHDFENLPSFMQHLESVKVIGDKSTSRISQWKARAPLGRSVEWQAEIIDERPNELIAWQSGPGSLVQNSGMVTFRDAPGGRGTEIHVSLKYNLPGGSASAALAKILGEEPGVQIREDLRRFKQKIETGEIATTLGQTSGRWEQTMKERGDVQKGKVIDVVQEASESSFPASDPPGWTSGNK